MLDTNCFYDRAAHYCYYYYYASFLYGMNITIQGAVYMATKSTANAKLLLSFTQ